MPVPNHCPSCGRDTIHYHADGKRPGEEIWLCDSCFHKWNVVVPYIG